MAVESDMAGKLVVHTRSNKQMQMHAVLQQDLGDDIEQVTFPLNWTCQD